jgi:hypothetical protein
MQRRTFLRTLASTGALIGAPALPRVVALPGAARTGEGAGSPPCAAVARRPPGDDSPSAWILITEGGDALQPRALPAGRLHRALAPGELLALDWDASLAARPPRAAGAAPLGGTVGILGAVGGANAVLLLESLRARRAAFRYVGPDARAAAAHAALPPDALASSPDTQFVVAVLAPGASTEPVRRT